MAITRGMRRVTISHCDFRRGYAMPSGFLADIPAPHRVHGWLRRPGPSAARRPAPAAGRLNAAELLEKF